MDWPYPPGTRVLGIFDVGGYAFPVRAGCDGHIFEIVNQAIRVDYACGYIQIAQCLVCGYTTPAVDADWWSQLPDQADLDRCIATIERERGRLGVVADALRLAKPDEIPEVSVKVNID